MSDTRKTDKLTIILRLQSKHDTEGATHTIRDTHGEMLVAWPDSGIARYKNGNIAPCTIDSKKFDSLLHELDPKHAPLKWQKVGDTDQAVALTTPGKIAAVCEVPKR